MCTFKNLEEFGKPGKNFEKTSGNPVNIKISILLYKSF